MQLTSILSCIFDCSSMPRTMFGRALGTDPAAAEAGVVAGFACTDVEAPPPARALLLGFRGDWERAPLGVARLEALLLEEAADEEPKGCDPVHLLGRLIAAVDDTSGHKPLVRLSRMENAGLLLLLLLAGPRVVGRTWLLSLGAVCSCRTTTAARHSCLSLLSLLGSMPSCLGDSLLDSILPCPGV